MPLTLEMERKFGRQVTVWEKEEDLRKVKRVINWDKEARKIYKERTELLVGTYSRTHGQ